MAWETRGNHKYFYRKHRVGRRVASEYVGASDVAQLYAEWDDLQQLEREKARAARDAERETERAIDAQLDDLVSKTQTLAANMLMACGYHQHKGQWRKQRYGRIHGPETTE